MTFDLSTLPDFPALQQLARALWRDGSLRGAAILVGAGFSRNALLSGGDTAPPPLWSNLLDDIKKQIYPSNIERAPLNPLRLAEEYRAFLGQAALNDFIRTRFPDPSWQPGALHKQLLNLPWSDVLTTNWDTLLERAAPLADDYEYEIVRFEADLPHARSPRIIKLHGTLGDSAPLIFAEEDYRTYPTKHAAFVNLARQIFIENELCLVGFSGDDPNFLQWAGWVRDQLGGTARRIYLVGCLDLPAATRKFLEAHNISPIDFGPAVHDRPTLERHAAASELFLKALQDAEPTPEHEWSLSSQSKSPLLEAGPEVFDRVLKDDVLAAKLLDQSYELAKKDRESYPGWFVCPAKYRQRLANGFNEAWLVRTSVLAHFNIEKRGKILSEFLWRQTTGLQPLRGNLGVCLVAFLNDQESKRIPLARLEFSLALLRNARLQADEPSFVSWSAILDAESAPDSPHRLEMYYQRCLRARDQLDLHALTEALEKIDKDEPVWQLRRAALHCELGDDTRATKLIREATAELERLYRLDKSSLWLKSCLGWANWLLRSSDAYRSLLSRKRQSEVRPREFNHVLVNPSGEIEAIQAAADRKFAEYLEEDVDVIPLFEAGHYRSHNGRKRLHPFGFTAGERQELDLLTETVGVPFYINHVGVANSAALSVALITAQLNVEWFVWLIRALHSHFDKPFGRYFSRVAVAQLSPELSEVLVATIDQAIAFWVERLKRVRHESVKDDEGHAIDELRLLVEVQSRLTVRMTESQAEATYRTALQRVQDTDLKHPWLSEAFGDLITYSAQAIPLSRQGHVAFAAIHFPLASEVGVTDRVWPNPVTCIWDSQPVRSPSDAQWSGRVRQLIIASGNGAPSRKEAVLRLTYLAMRNALLPDESELFAKALWADIDAEVQGLPANTDLLPGLFTQLPAPQDVDVLARVRTRVLGFDVEQDAELGDLSGAINTQILGEKLDRLAGLANANRFGLKIAPSKARLIFDQLLRWSQPDVEDRDPFTTPIAESFFERTRSLIGEVLCKVIVPAMRSHDRNRERGKALLLFATRQHVWGGLVALPYFFPVSAKLAGEIQGAIRRGLTSIDFQHAANAALALERWSTLAQKKTVKPVPDALFDQLITAIETRQQRGLQVSLKVTQTFIAHNLIRHRAIKRLIVALDDLRDETNYRLIELNSHAAVSVSLVRCECAKLARLLLTKGYSDPTLAMWVKEAENDPLPEVRFCVGKT